MGKKDKTKLKSKSGGGSDGHGRDAANNVELSEDPGAAAIAGWGRSSHAGADKIDGFGPGGWGDNITEEHQHVAWQPEPGGGGTWDAPAPNIGDWLGDRGEEIPGLFGSGPKKHPSAAVRMSLASQALGGDPSPDVAAFLASMQAHTPSPKRAPTELSVHRSSAAYSSNPIRSALPTRSNSISGVHTAPNTGAYPALPNAASLQQTRFFQTRPSQPLSTIHSERSLYTIGASPAEAASAPPGVSHHHRDSHLQHRDTWLPHTAPAGMDNYGFEDGYMTGDYLDHNISTEMLGMQNQAEMVSFQESGGEALLAADLALFRSQRPASERLYWHFDPNNDERVSGLLEWVEVMSHGLATLALHKYLNTRCRGALISNAAYRPEKTPEEPAFDWITFEQARGTLDATFQEGIAKYDPSTTFIVYIFLLSPTGNSMGIWKRKLPIPAELRNEYAGELAQVNAYVNRKPHVIAVEKLPPNARTPGAPNIRHSTKPYGSTTQHNQPSSEKQSRSRTASTPTPAKNVLTRGGTKKDATEKKEKRSTWSRIFGGKK